MTTENQGAAELLPHDTTQCLVSILVRSMQRASLTPALEALAAQACPDLEVLLINAAGKHHAEPELSNKVLRWRLSNQDGRPLSRPQAANWALDHATGQYLLFLDDDDLIDADHIARLRTALRSEPDAVAAYTGVRMIGPDGQAAGVLDEPFDSARLLLANFLPIHAVMFRRDAVIAAGARFDESMPVYEDWDFWRQLSLAGRFVHLPGVSATYRLIGDSGLSAQASRQVVREGRARFYAKWLPRLDSAELDRLATTAELHRAGLAAQTEQLRSSQEAMQQLHAEGQQALAVLRSHAQAVQNNLHAEVQARDVALKEAGQHHANLAAVVGELERVQVQLQADHAAHIAAHEQVQVALHGQLAAAQADHAAKVAAHEQAQVALHGQLAVAQAQYQRLDQSHRQVIASLSWRITAPLRDVRAYVSGPRLRAVARRLARALPLSPSLKMRGKVWLSTQGPWASTVMRWVAPQAAVVATLATTRSTSSAPPSGFDKEQVRALAEAELSAFLAGAQTLQLRHGGGAPKVSVVVVLYNQAGLTLLCLQALAASVGVEFETIIVDNASSDRTAQLLNRITGARVLRQDSNLGFLRAVNLSANHARGEFMLLLNNDAVVEPNTLANAVARLDAEPSAGAVGGPILLWDGRLQEAGSVIWRDGSCQGYGRGDMPEASAYQFVRDVDYCSGAFLMLRRELFEELGRFDEVFAPAYYEETDFCVSLWEHGHRVVYDPKVRVKHFEFASDIGSGQALALQQRNRDRFVARHESYLRSRPEASAGAVLAARQILPPGKRRVLIIDDRVPLPALGRGYPRAAMLAKAIASAGHQLCYYPLQFADASAEDVAAALDPRTEVMLHEGLAGLPAFLAQRAGLYDLMLISRPHNWEFVQSHRQLCPQWFAGAKLVYDAEAMFSLRDIEKAKVMGRALPPQQAQALIDKELALSRRADRIVAVSDDEAQHYRAAGCDDVVTLGHALALSPSRSGFAQRDGFLFVGAIALDDCPNGDSILWFAREVWPLIQKVMGPDARLDLVGVCESPAVLALASESIRIHGRVAELAPFFDAARVFVVPTRFAAGIAHKVHEAAAHGLPMVVTPLIAQQLGWATQELLIGNEAQDFAAACLRLHGDAPCWASLRAALLTAVERDCSALVFSSAVQEILR